jgi:hypothetical protein
MKLELVAAVHAILSMINSNLVGRLRSCLYALVACHEPDLNSMNKSRGCLPLPIPLPFVSVVRSTIYAKSNAKLKHARHVPVAARNLYSL